MKIKLSKTFWERPKDEQIVRLVYLLFFTAMVLLSLSVYLFYFKKEVYASVLLIILSISYFIIHFSYKDLSRNNV